jgi:hypothetical protein
MKYVTLTTVDDTYQAYFVKKALEDEGIQCMIFNEHASNLLPLAGPMAPIVDIKVLDDDHEAALKILTDLRAKTDVVHCPNCGSTNVEYGLGSKNKIKRIAVFMMAIFFWIPVSRFHLVYHCKDCQTEFRKSKF